MIDMLKFSNQVNSNLSVEVLVSNLKTLASQLNDATYKESKEIQKNMTYYSNILYNKVDTETYMNLMEEVDEMRA
jgi:hypothetical protein